MANVVFKSEDRGLIYEGPESPDLQPVKETLRILRSAEQKLDEHRGSLRAAVDVAARNYVYEVKKYVINHCKPRWLNDKDEYTAYIEALSGTEIVRPCFVQHEGTPNYFPCIVVTVRMPSTGLNAGYVHRFLYGEDLEHLGLPDKTKILSWEGHDEPCYYCQKPCNSLAGNPGEWPVCLSHQDEPGVPKWHHVECVSRRLREREALRSIVLRMLQWDHLDGSGDGPYWRKELLAALGEDNEP